MKKLGVGTKSPDPRGPLCITGSAGAVVTLLVSRDREGKPVQAQLSVIYLQTSYLLLAVVGEAIDFHGVLLCTGHIGSRFYF